MKRATCEVGVLCDELPISIHALVKRATGAIVLDVSKVDISIHALVKRATRKPFKFSSNSLFQSTPS